VDLEDARVAVVGLGLIGGSLALGLQRRCRQIAGVDADPKAVALARQAGVQAHRELRPALTSADVIVLATPVRETVRLLQAMASDPPNVELVLDTGSTKRQVVEAMESLPLEVPAVGGHPLSGKERSGFAEADPGLFAGSAFVLTPCARTTPAALALAEQLVLALGASPHTMEAARHDRLLAITSHLPYLLAAALLDSAETFARDDERLWEMVASGFLGATRLAASDLTMVVDILATNQDLALSALSAGQAALERLRELLAAGDPGALRAHLGPVQQRRLSLSGPDGSGHAA
jgi:prephenate dehydrogenase